MCVCNEGWDGCVKAHWSISCVCVHVCVHVCVCAVRGVCVCEGPL